MPPYERCSLISTVEQTGVERTPRTYALTTPRWRPRLMPSTTFRKAHLVMQRVHHLVERLPLRSKLILLAALPLCAALFAMGSLTLSARTTMNEANATTRTVSLAVAIGDLLHETQKERGSSAVYLSSGGETFGAELRAQHAATDVALDALIEQLEQSRADLDVEIASAADVVLAELAEVPSLRVAVVAVDADLGPTIRTYTGINRQLLAIIQSIEGAQPSAETARGSLAYRSVLEGKEAAGIMRAQFANAFTNDAFGDGQLAMLISLQATRNNALNQFSGFTTAELLAVDTQRRSGSAFEQVTAIETAAIASSAGNFGVDPVAWFDIKTTYINELKNLEDLQAQTILDDADRTSAASTGAFWSLIIGFLVLTTLVVALSLVVIENVIQSLQKVRSHAGGPRRAAHGRNRDASCRHQRPKQSAPVELRNLVRGQRRADHRSWPDLRPGLIGVGRSRRGVGHCEVGGGRSQPTAGKRRRDFFQCDHGHRHRPASRFGLRGDQADHRRARDVFQRNRPRGRSHLIDR